MEDGVLMKRKMFVLYITAILCMGIVGTCAAAEPSVPTWKPLSEVGPGNAFIPAGTVINCELITPISSAQSNVGQPVMFRTIENLNVGNVPIIRYGSAGKAFVSIARKAGSFGAGGKIEMRPVSLKTIDGIEVPVVFGVDLTKYNNMQDIDTSSIPQGLQKKGGGKQVAAALFSAEGIASIWYGLRTSNVNEAEIYNSYWGSYVAGGLFLLFAGAAIQGEDQQIPPFARFQVTVVKDVDLGVYPEALQDKMSPYFSSSKPSGQSRIQR